MEQAIKKIQDINEETHVLALNAAIEASSAGGSAKRELTYLYGLLGADGVKTVLWAP